MVLLQTMPLSFNSIKVRLKLDKSFTELRVIRFQFHKGPIKARAFLYENSRECVSIP